MRPIGEVALRRIGVALASARCGFVPGRCHICSRAVGFRSTRTLGKRAAADDDLADAADLRELLRHDGGGRVVHLGLRSGFGGQREHEMGESAGFTLRYVGLLGRFAGR